MYHNDGALDPSFGGTGIEHDPLTIMTIDRSALHGGDGNDTIFSGPGVDSLYGGAGNGRIHSEQVNDFISAGGGNGVIMTDNFAVSVNGGAGNDRVYANRWCYFIGGDGDDFINHARAAWGGRGNDTLHSSGGADATLVGGPGNDVFFSSDLPGDTLNGGGGNDTATADDGDVLISIETIE
jgi:Ca2+-binding RTX toxin-like protein